MKRWILVCAIVVLGAGIYVFVEVSHAEPRLASRVGPPGVAAVPVAPLVATRRGEPSPAISIQPRTPAPAEPTTKDDRAGSGAPPTVEEMRDHIEASFAGEAPAAPSLDRTLDIERRIRDVIPAGSSVRKLECRSALCRIETMHPSLDEFRDFAQRGYLTLDFATRISPGPVFVGLLAPPVEGQPVIAVAFLGREGSVLPVPGAVGSSGD